MNMAEYFPAIEHRDFSHFLALIETRTRSHAQIKTRVGSVVADPFDQMKDRAPEINIDISAGEDGGDPEVAKLMSGLGEGETRLKTSAFSLAHLAEPLEIHSQSDVCVHRVSERSRQCA